jgi:ribonuclease G
VFLFLKNRRQKRKDFKKTCTIKPKGFGVIVRTVAEGKKYSRIRKDLLSRWTAMCKKLPTAHHPSKLGELNRAFYLKRFLMIPYWYQIDDEELYNQTKDYLQEIAPSNNQLLSFINQMIHLFLRNTT